MMKERVAERLSALAMSAAEASRRAGLERSFVRDLLNGKKVGVRGLNLQNLATALQCHPDYLTGHRDDPDREAGALGEDSVGLPLVAIAETGVFRSRTAPIEAATLPVPRDPRFAWAKQALYLARGPGGEDFGIDEDMLATGIDAEDVVSRGGVRDGAIVVVRRTRKVDGETETEHSFRRVEISTGRIALVAPESSNAPPIVLSSIPGDDSARIVAVVCRAIRLF